MSYSSILEYINELTKLYFLTKKAEIMATFSWCKSTILNIYFDTII